MSRSPRWQPKSDGPAGQRRRHHDALGNPTIADAVLDRLVHGAHRLDLKGESMRKLRAAKARLDETAAA